MSSLETLQHKYTFVVSLNGLGSDISLSVLVISLATSLTDLEIKKRVLCILDVFAPGLADLRSQEALAVGGVVCGVPELLFHVNPYRHSTTRFFMVTLCSVEDMS